MSSIIGTITPPASIPSSPVATTDFLRAIIVFIIVLAGIYAFWQILIAGFNYISASGDKGKVEVAQQKINHAIVGLVIIALSFLISAIAGKLLFNDPGFIINPKIETVHP